MVNVHAPLTLSGTILPVFVQLEPMDQTVYLVQPQEVGIIQHNNVSAQPKEFGTILHVFVNQAHMDLTVLNAQLNNIGMQLLNHADAHHHTYLLDNTVYAQPVLLDQTVLHAQHQEHGTTTHNNVSVTPPPQTGLEANVFAQQEHLDLNASNAQLNSIGIQLLNHVDAHLHTYSLDNIVYAQLEPLDQTVLHAQHQEHGIQTKTNVYATVQPLTGTEINAFAQPELSEPTVRLVLPQDSGTAAVTNASAQPKKHGMDQTVSANLDSLDLTVFNAQLDKIGTTLLKTVSALHRLSGTELNALVPLPTSFTTVNVRNALLDTIGLTTLVNNVIAQLLISSIMALPVLTIVHQQPQTPQ